MLFSKKKVFFLIYWSSDWFFSNKWYQLYIIFKQVKGEETYLTVRTSEQFQKSGSKKKFILLPPTGLPVKYSNANKI